MRINLKCYAPLFIRTKILLTNRNGRSIIKVDQHTEYGQQIKNAHQLHKKPQPPIVKG